MTTAMDSRSGSAPRPAFMAVDARGRVLDQSMRTAVEGGPGALRCWELLTDRVGERQAVSCRHCAIGEQAPTAATATDALPAGRPECIPLPRSGPDGGALVWLRSPHDPPSGTDRLLAQALLDGALAQALAGGDSGLALEAVRGALGAEGAELRVNDAAGELLLRRRRGCEDLLAAERREMDVAPGRRPVATLRRHLSASPADSPETTAEGPRLTLCGGRAWASIPLRRVTAGAGTLRVAWQRSRHGEIPLGWLVDLLKRAADPIAQLVSADLEQSAKPATPALEIRCLGPLEVSVDGEALPPEAFGRRGALAVLGRLALEPGRRVPRDELIAALWPGVTTDVGANRLYGLVHSLRRAIEPAARRGQWICCRAGAYWLADRPGLAVDLHRFARLVTSAARQDASPSGDRAAVRLLEKALSLSRGDLFEGLPAADWFREERARARRLRAEARRMLAQRWERLGQPDWARELRAGAAGHSPER